MIVVLDNYDSFVYNLVQYLGELGEAVTVFRNDAVSVEQIRGMSPSAVLVSPGPCTPEEAGISMDLIRSMAGLCPVLGVCLGHQAIVTAFGGKVTRARNILHGKVSSIRHDGRSIYSGVENPFPATRYHSLIVERGNLPDCLEVSAWTDRGEVMGIRHRTLPVEGVQFHPESILTDTGMKILKNFLVGCRN
jgi:anthranilate synthase/aminodeoxychorismate synthase-like glutamine amidotransferase